MPTVRCIITSLRCRGRNASRRRSGRWRKVANVDGPRICCSNRWHGRTPMTIDTSQRISIDADVRPLDVRALSLPCATRARAIPNYNMNRSNFAPVAASPSSLEIAMADYNRWSTADLHRYHHSSPCKSMRSTPRTRIDSRRAARVEKFRLGIAERIEDHPTPRRVHDEPFVTTERAFVEQDGRASNITTLVPRPETDAPDTEPECAVTRTRSSRTASEATTRTGADG